MTVTTLTSTQTFIFDGPGDYPFTFKIIEPEDLAIYFTHPTTGERTRLIYTTDYTVEVATPPSIGGIATILTYFTTDGILSLYREMPYTQETEWVNNNEFDMTLLEASFDRTVMLIQQMKVLVDESIFVQGWQGIWQTGYTYNAGSIVKVTDSHYYICLVSHIANVFETDLVAGYWEVFLDAYYINLAANAVVDAEAARDAALVAQTAAETAETNAELAETNAETALAACEVILGQITPLPAGIIVPWLGGYFEDAANNNFHMVLATGNDVDSVNTFLNPQGFYVCNGAELDLGAGSGIFDGTARHLPNLTDARFIEGLTYGGAKGGATNMMHTHTIASHYHSMQSHTHSMQAHRHSLEEHTHTIGSHVLTLNEIPSHWHYAFKSGGGSGTQTAFATGAFVSNVDEELCSYVTGPIEYNAGSHLGHTHTCGVPSVIDTSEPSSASTGVPSTTNVSTVSTVTSSEASNYENRPQFLSCFYIMRVV